MFFYSLILTLFSLSFCYSGICVGNDLNNTVIRFNLAISSCFYNFQEFALPENFCSLNFIPIDNYLKKNSINDNCFYGSYGYYSPNMVS